MASTKKDAGIVKLGTNLYEIRVRVTCPRTGRRKELERVRECTLTEARALQHQWRSELLASLEKPRPDRIRLKDFAASWLTGKRGLIKQGTAEHIASVWDLHIGPTKIASLHIDDIAPEDIEEWIATMRTKTYERHGKVRTYRASTVRGAFDILREVIVVACARHRLPNPFDGVKAPSLGRSRDNFLRRDDAARVVAFVREHEPNWYAAVLVALTTGLRWSELSALRWDDLDERDGVIRVVRNQYEGRLQTSTKNGEDEDSPRVVPLLPEVATVLRERRMHMVRDQHPGLAEGWIFPTRTGELHHSTPLTDVLARACKALGIRRITTHGLRHTANDLLRRSTSDVVTRAIVGHATEAMSRHYSHVDTNEMIEAAKAAFGDVITGVKKGGSR